MPTIDLSDDEVAALTEALRRLIPEDRFPHAPRLDPLLGAGEARSGDGTEPAAASPRRQADAAITEGQLRQ